MDNGNTPTRKITAAGIGGAITIIVVWIANTLASVAIPPEVASAFTTLITFGTGYLVKDA